MAKKKARRASKTAARTKPASTKRAASKPKPARVAKTQSVPMYLVDAFTRRRFHGNAAGVVVLDKAWLPTETMQAIAAENNQAETAFVLRGAAGKHKLRWFTPTIEMDLCGHATLAAAHVLWTHEKEKARTLNFASASGNLPVERRGDLVVLDFPSRPGKPVPVTPAMCAALGRTPVEAYLARDLMFVFENKREVHELQPDLWKISQMDALGVIVTAPGAGHDFVSRFFAPRAGVPEDPVTGSAHCTLVPYWAARLKRSIVSGHQVSRRGGELFCELVGKRVHIGGHAVTFFAGTITV